MLIAPCGSAVPAVVFLPVIAHRATSSPGRRLLLGRSRNTAGDADQSAISSPAATFQELIISTCRSSVGMRRWQGRCSLTSVLATQGKKKKPDHRGFPSTAEKVSCITSSALKQPGPDLEKKMFFQATLISLFRHCFPNPKEGLATSPRLQ